MPMHPRVLTTLVVNIVGGIAVLASYALGFAGDPDAGEKLWGGVPAALRPAYTVSMLLATAGYFAFTYFILFRLPPERTRVAESFGYGLFTVLYAAILFPSALWMPLTFRMLEAPTDSLWLATRSVLAIVGIASVLLVAGLSSVRPREPRAAWYFAIAGAAAFAVQTALLDAIVWPSYFPSGS